MKWYSLVCPKCGNINVRKKPVLVAIGRCKLCEKPFIFVNGDRKWLVKLLKILVKEKVKR